MGWPEIERRSCASNGCSESARLTEIEAKLADMQELKDDVKAIKMLLEQGKGMARLLQIVFYVVGPLIAAVYWIKEHVR